MILISNSDIPIICAKYTNSILNEIMARVKILTDLIPLLKDTNQVTYHNIVGNYDSFRKALGPLLNKKSLKSNNKVSLLDNINLYRTTVNARLDSIMYILKNKDLKVRLEEIISSKPELLKSYQKKLVKYFKLDQNDLIFKYLFSYDDFYSKIISPIASDLGIVVCPYCNRSYITHVKGKNAKRIIGPTFDHFFHQAKNPLLSLSFYNLIPSCSLCNSNLKGQKEFELNYNLHPYLVEMGNDAIFDFNLKLIGSGQKKEIIFCPKISLNVKRGDSRYKRLKKTHQKNGSGNLDVFKIEEIYASHHDTVEEVYKKFDRNSSHYVKSIADQLKKIGVGEDEFYRFHFGNYFKEFDFHKRPLAKLTKDIYNKMKKNRKRLLIKVLPLLVRTPTTAENWISSLQNCITW